MLRLGTGNREPPIRGTQRANGQYKDHLVGQLTTLWGASVHTATTPSASLIWINIQWAPIKEFSSSKGFYSQMVSTMITNCQLPPKKLFLYGIDSLSLVQKRIPLKPSIYNQIWFLVDMNYLFGIRNMTVMPGCSVISRTLRVADYYNYEVEIRFPVRTLQPGPLVCQIIQLSLCATRWGLSTCSQC